jgi:hypothetical protein
MPDKNKKRGLPQNYDNVYPWIISMGIRSPESSPDASPEGAPAQVVAESYDYDYSGVNRLSDRLAKHTEENSGSLSDSDKEAVISYTKHSSILNKHLFKKKDSHQEGGSYSDPIQDARAEQISKVISTVKPYHRGFRVYSGMHSSIPPELIQQHGGIFHIPKFLSSSTSPEIAQRFAGKDQSNERHIVRFEIPSGFNKGIFVGGISHKDDEHEYLMDKNQLIHISHKVASYKDKKGNDVHVWHGKVLDDDEAKGFADKHPFAKAEYDSAMAMRTKKITESEEFEVPNIDKGLDLQRRQLPQIDKDSLLNDLKGKTSKVYLDPSHLIPSQKHFNFDKVKKLAGKDRYGEIIVSKDNHVIDGHHRWLADHAVGRKSKAIVVHMNANDLLDYLSDKEYVKTKTLKENTEHPMIDVDGVQKHLHNNLGERIHDTDEGVKNFHRWFGSSKIVDKHGRPMVVYHGTNNENITSFDPEKAGSVQYADWGKGVYTATSKDNADYYRIEAVKKHDPEYNNLFSNFEKSNSSEDLNKFRSRGKELNSTEKGKTYPLYLKLENPHVEDAGSSNDPFLERHAKESGKDGLIIKGTYGTEIVAFHPSQIKSADSNSGEFSSKDNINEAILNPEVYYHGTKDDIQSIDHARFGTGHDENGPGFYMTSSPIDAATYSMVKAKYVPGSNIMPVHHAINNPMPTNHVFQHSHIKELIAASPNLDENLKNFGAGTPTDSNINNLVERTAFLIHAGQDIGSPRNGINVLNALHRDFYKGHAGKLLKKVNELTGHDGVIVQRTPTVKHAVAWFPHQVKGVYGNKDTSKEGIMENKESDE